MTSARFFLRIAAISGCLAVVLGAFGAHALRGYLPDNLFSAYQTAVFYHFIHTLVLLMVGLMLRHRHNVSLRVSAWAFIFGFILFSGSLYLMAMSGWRALGVVTPLGGVCLIFAWASLAWATREVFDET